MFLRSQAGFLHTQSQTAPTFPGNKEEDVVMRLTINLPVIYGGGGGGGIARRVDKKKGKKRGEGKGKVPLPEHHVCLKSGVTMLCFKSSTTATNKS